MYEIKNQEKEINNLLEKSKNNFNIILIKQDEQNHLHNQLKEDKSLRNKLITERSVLVNEIEFIKVI